MSDRRAPTTRKAEDLAELVSRGAHQVRQALQALSGYAQDRYERDRAIRVGSAMAALQSAESALRQAECLADGGLKEGERA